MILWKPLVLVTFCCLYVRHSLGLAGNGNGILRRPTPGTSVADKLVGFCVRHPNACSRKREMAPKRPILHEIILRKKIQHQLKFHGGKQNDPDSGIRSILSMTAGNDYDSNMEIREGLGMSDEVIDDQGLRHTYSNYEERPLSSEFDGTENMVYKGFGDSSTSQAEDLDDGETNTEGNLGGASKKKRRENNLGKLARPFARPRDLLTSLLDRSRRLQ